MTYNHVSKTLLVGTETSWATGGSADKAVGLILTDITSNISKELIESYRIGSLEVQNLSAGVQEGKLSISGEWQSGKLLDYVFGGTTTHSLTGSDTTHTYVVGAGNSATFHSALDGSTDTSLVYTGMLCESVEISSAINETVKCKYEFRGKAPTVGTSTTAQSTLTIPPSPHSFVTITVAGVEASEVQEANVTISREIRFSDSLGSNDHEFGAPTQLKFEYSAKVGFAANTYHSLGLAAESAGNFIFAVDNGTSLGSGKRALTITISAKTQEVNELVTVGELVYVEVKGTGTLSSATSVDNIASASW